MARKIGRLPDRPSSKYLQGIAFAVRRKFGTIPIAVRYGKPGNGTVGTCTLSEDQPGLHFDVIIHSKLRDHAAVMGVLEHELAHCVAWFDHADGGRHHHGPSWGLAFASVYCFLYKTT